MADSCRLAGAGAVLPYADASIGVVDGNFLVHITNTANTARWELLLHMF